MQIKKHISRALALLCIILIMLPATISNASATNSANTSNKIVINAPYFDIIMNKNIFYIILVIMLVIAITILALFMKSKKRQVVDKKAKEEGEKLKDKFTELKSAYEEIKSNHKKLKNQYDELQESADKNKKLAFTDLLTQLPNGTAFVEKLDQVMLTLRKEEIIGIIYLDIDNFKEINDSLGNSYGDELLIDVTHRLKQVMDDNDFLARYSGDEFIVLTQNIEDMSEYETKIKKIQKVIHYPFVLSLKEFFVTISLGIAFAPKDAKTTQNLIKNAVSAMYVAKEMGKNTFCYFDDGINHRLMEKIERQSELKQAIADEQFLLHYQTQVSLSTDRIVGFEALIRWNHPTKGIISPAEFVSIAEETGLIVPIGRFVLKEACNQLKLWSIDGYHDLEVSVNISVRQFKDEGFVEMVKEVVTETEIDPKQLVLEITEPIVLEDMNYAITVMQELSVLGIRFSLDDFGTGYSSINYLKELPLSYLKIDKSYLDSISENKNNQKMVQAFVKLAQTIDLEVIAEGVENKGQVIFLKNIRCNKAQGYLYSKPVPKEEAKVLLDNWASFLE